VAETPFTPTTPAGQPEDAAVTPADAAAGQPAQPEAPIAEPAAASVEPELVVVETLVETEMLVETEAVVETLVDEEPAPTEPSIAATLEVPPLPGAGSGSEAAGEGGEFDLLISKVSAWLEGLELAERWQKLRGPLRGAALLLGLLLVLRLYARLVGTIDGIPVISGLLELTGLIYVLRFSATRLIRTSERERVLADWKQRWQAFSGRD